MKNLLCTLLVLLLSNFMHGQNAQQFLQGFTKEISGKRFGYHSSLPDVNTSLLLRGQQDFSPLEWETEIVPHNFNQKEISFKWLFGMDVSSSPADFHLSVNGKALVDLAMPKPLPWVKYPMRESRGVN